MPAPLSLKKSRLEIILSSRFFTLFADGVSDPQAIKKSPIITIQPNSRLNIYLVFENTETDLMGRFRYWLLGDIIRKEGATILCHRISATQCLKRLKLCLGIAERSK